jgi:glycosyltransferase involved in cell wall biosynthesis
VTPTVTVAIPVLNEEAALEACLRSVTAQTYAGIVEILVADGGSRDRTRELARAVPGVRVLDNPGVRQAAGMNVMLREAKGDVVVRVDGHCVLAPDYVERCVAALTATGAAMVGGGMTPIGAGTTSRAIAWAMRSRLGAGPARFHVGGAAGWTDTVYLGAFRTDVVLAADGYAEDVGVNEDAELAIRLGPRGGVWFDPAIRSSYAPRASVRSLAEQFFRYGRSRAATVRRHPRATAWRQLCAPALVIGLLSPRRRTVATVYAGVLAAGAVGARREGGAVAMRVPPVLAAMHLAWGTGFLLGLVSPPRARS